MFLLPAFPQLRLESHILNSFFYPSISFREPEMTFSSRQRQICKLFAAKVWSRLILSTPKAAIELGHFITFLKVKKTNAALIRKSNRNRRKRHANKSLIYFSDGETVPS